MLFRSLGYKKIQDRCEIVKPVEWDEFTAYFYGFMLGDGNLSNRLGDFRVASTDFDVIEKINECLTHGTRTVHHRKQGSFKEQAYLSITDKTWYNFLSKMGLCPNKSHKQLFLLYPHAEYIPPFESTEYHRESKIQQCHSVPERSQHKTSGTS